MKALPALLTRSIAGLAALLVGGPELAGAPASVQVRSLETGQGVLRVAPEDPANIVFVLTDDHRWDSLGCSGNAAIRTPNLDRLAREGARFSAMYAASPVCSASRAALLSGLYPHQTGVLNNDGSGGSLLDLPDGIPTIAHYLERAGYATGLIGKVHLGGDPFRHGFQEAPVYAPGGGCAYFDPFLTVDGVRQRVFGEATQIFADAAIEFLEQHRNDRFFLWWAPTAPHIPHQAYPDFPYDPALIPPPPGWSGGPWPFQSELFADYYSTISNLDFQIGRIVDAIDALGLAENTLIVVLGDNGDMLGDHARRGKETWFEASARVPALARWRGHIPPRTVVRSPVVSTDLFATFLDAANFPRPAGYECRSTLPALTRRAPHRKHAYSEILQSLQERGYWRMVVSDGLKYVVFLDGWPHGGEEHLYDLSVDPGELQDLILRPDYAPELDRLRQIYADWLSATRAPGPF